MKFMVDAIVDLKNNRTKALTSTSVVTSEATVRMKKLLGSLGGRNLRSGGERLGVTLEDIRNIEKKGKWWLPGASWKDDGLSLQLNNPGLSETDKLVIQARRRGMNTEVRVSIFVALMGGLVRFPFDAVSNSQDYIDAHRRISLLQLKKNRMQEIATVLVTCCLKENPQAPYNAFYSVVAKRLCSPSSSLQVARAVRRGLQFRLWGFFREWGENSDDGWEGNENDYDEAVDEDQKLIRTVKLAKLYGDLIVGGVLSLDVLKVSVITDLAHV
jgi:nucleolar MIF4G domain-containing protein 1